MKAVHYTDCYCESCEDARRQLDSYEVANQFPCGGSVLGDIAADALVQESQELGMYEYSERFAAYDAGKPKIGKTIHVQKPVLPADPTERKNVPLYTGLVSYFPDALAYVARISDRGSKQHHPTEPLHWDRSKSTDHHDCLLRHLWDAGTVDTDGMLHSGKVAWRALAALQLELEKCKQ